MRSIGQIVLLLIVAVMDVRIAVADEAAKPAQAKAELTRFVNAMGNLQADCGGLPSEQQGLNALLSDPGFKGWNGPYLSGPLPVDPWKTPYRYRWTKAYYEVRSAGPDAKFDTSDDISIAPRS